DPVTIATLPFSPMDVLSRSYALIQSQPTTEYATMSGGPIALWWEQEPPSAPGPSVGHGIPRSRQPGRRGRNRVLDRECSGAGDDVSVRGPGARCDDIRVGPRRDDSDRRRSRD